MEVVNSSLQLSVVEFHTVLYSASSSAHTGGGLFSSGTISSWLLTLTIISLGWSSNGGLLSLIGGGHDLVRDTCINKDSRLRNVSGTKIDRKNGV